MQLFQAWTSRYSRWNYARRCNYSIAKLLVIVGESSRGSAIATLHDIKGMVSVARQLGNCGKSLYINIVDDKFSREMQLLKSCTS